MRRDEINQELQLASFEFFYWFSRFESSLKENRFLKSEKPGSNAEPSWESFEKTHAIDYELSSEAIKLVKLHPKRQIVEDQFDLGWKRVGIDHCNSELSKVKTMLLTIRNNLFHGGKHGDFGMNDLQKNLELLKLGKIVLDQLADFSGLESDYKKEY